MKRNCKTCGVNSTNDTIETCTRPYYSRYGYIRAKKYEEEKRNFINRIGYLESVLEKAFNCLIRANAEGKITDTLWVTDLTTLWDVFSVALKIENIEEYENEVLNDSES